MADKILISNHRNLYNIYTGYTFSQYPLVHIILWKKSTSLRHWQTGGECKIELRYFYYISLCYIYSIIVITVLAYITVVALLLVAYFSIVMLWQDIIYRI
jgi:hypothetical protein